MYSRVYASTRISMYLCIYLCIYIYIRGRRVATSVFGHCWHTFERKGGMLSRQEKSIIHVRKNRYISGSIWYRCFSEKKTKYDTCERVVCLLERKLIFASKSLVFWWLQQTATDCNRLQQTATDCNRKKAHLCVKEPCIPMRKSPTLPPTTSLQQTATERALQFLQRPSHFPVSDLSTCMSIYPCIYLWMCLCIYARMFHACMHLRVYLCICLCKYACMRV